MYRVYKGIRYTYMKAWEYPIVAVRSPSIFCCSALIQRVSVPLPRLPLLHIRVYLLTGN